MDTLTLKIPEEINQKLRAYSKNKGLSKSEIVRNALVEYFDKDNIKKGSFYDLAKDLAGCVQEAPDLSTNKKYLSGYGR